MSENRYDVISSSGEEGFCLRDFGGPGRFFCMGVSGLSFWGVLRFAFRGNTGTLSGMVTPRPLELSAINL